MKSLFKYFLVWISGIVVFTIGYTIYLRENDIPVKYETEIPVDIRIPVYIFSSCFLFFLIIFKVFASYMDSSSK